MSRLSFSLFVYVWSLCPAQVLPLIHGVFFAITHFRTEYFSVVFVYLFAGTLKELVKRERVQRHYSNHIWTLGRAVNGAEGLQVVQDLQKAGTKRSVNGIGQPGGDPHYYSCQREPRILFLDQQIRAIPWTYPRLCQGILFNSRQQFQVKSAAICTPHGMGFPSGLWLLAFWAVSHIH